MKTERREKEKNNEECVEEGTGKWEKEEEKKRNRKTGKRGEKIMDVWKKEN